MSVRLTTSLSQRLVLTPQLRQRIEMLQMTTLELTDLIQQQLTENPVLEEVASQEEAQELAEKILDHMAGGGEFENFEAPTVEATIPDAPIPDGLRIEGYTAETDEEFRAVRNEAVQDDLGGGVDHLRRQRCRSVQPHRALQDLRRRDLQDRRGR